MRIERSNLIKSEYNTRLVLGRGNHVKSVLPSFKDDSAKPLHVKECNPRHNRDKNLHLHFPNSDKKNQLNHLESKILVRLPYPSYDNPIQSSTFVCRVNSRECMSLFQKIRPRTSVISLGTTGARVADVNYRYKLILQALNEANINNWSEPTEQQRFARVLTERGVFDISEENTIGSDKDARLKTSYISDLGLTTEDRAITPAGRAYLDCHDEELTDWEISESSQLIFFQLLKYQFKGSDNSCYPFLQLIYAIIDFENALPLDFFSYVWATSLSPTSLKQAIQSYRRDNKYRSSLWLEIKQGENCRIAEENAKKYNQLSSQEREKHLQDLIYANHPHGKGDRYKAPLIPLYNSLHKYWLCKDAWSVEERISWIRDTLTQDLAKLKGKSSKEFIRILLGVNSLPRKRTKEMWMELIAHFDATELMTSVDLVAFIKEYHILYAYAKQIDLCDEYRDLNLRHLKMCDCFIIEQEVIKLDILFYKLFAPVYRQLLDAEIIADSKAYRQHLEHRHKRIQEIYPFINDDSEIIKQQILSEHSSADTSSFRNYFASLRNQRLNTLAHSIFTRETLASLLTLFIERNDKAIRESLRDLYQEYDASIPALFEYLLALSFYWLSGEKVDIHESLQMHLDANLYPRTHAPGGGADIVIRNLMGIDYLIEATLSEQDGQRRMEAEPVPRHLAQHLRSEGRNAISIFIAPKLDANNLVILRIYKFLRWYYSDGEISENLLILPLSVQNIITLLQSQKSFEELSAEFMELLALEERDGKRWYDDFINVKY